MGFGAKAIRMIEKTKSYIQLVRDSFVEVADGSATVWAKRPNYAFGFGKRLGVTFNYANLVGAVAHPNDQWASDGSTTVGVVVVTNPEGVAAYIRDDGPAETSTAFLSIAHSLLPPFS